MCFNITAVSWLKLDMKYYLLVFIVFLSNFLFSQEKEYFTFKEALQEPDSVKILSLGDYRFDEQTDKIFKLDSRIKELKNLEELKFTCNYLDSLPSDITELKKLKSITILDADNLSAPFNNCKLDFSDTFIKLSKINTITRLYIPFIKITLPSEIKYLTNIKIFTLVDNKLKDIPEEISQMINLRAIYINYNELNTLPNSLSSLDSLINLNLLHNNFDSIPSVVFNITTLKYLDLSYNMIKNLPIEIENLRSLKQLDLKRNMISELPKELFNCEDLEILDLSDNKISNMPIDVFALKKLKKLDISGNSLSEMQIQILKDYLKGVEVIN